VTHVKQSKSQKQNTNKGCPTCLVDHCEPHSAALWQRFWKILHHAFQSCAAFEGCLLLVGVLGVNKLCNDAFMAGKLVHVGGKADDQLVDIACDGVGIFLYFD
jgi:hypothetical protein